MKRILLTSAILLAAASFASAQQAEKAPELEFTTVKELPITPIKNQASSGTCWAFSTISFLESEAIRINNIKDPAKYPDFSEFFVVSHSYADRADKFVRLNGNLTFGAGSEADDVLHVVRDYGIASNESMTGMNYGTPLPAQSEMDSVLKAYIQAVAKLPNRTLTTAWMRGFQGILDAYLGEYPETFVVDGVEYTPASYRDALKINPDDYVTLTSFTHHPFYTKFAIEVCDNWRWDEAYNLPIDEFMQVLDNAIDKGFTAAWGTDCSESGFTRQGLGQLIDFLDIGTMIDRAVPDFADPVPRADGFDSGVIANLKATYAEMKRRGTTLERFRLERGSTQLDPLHAKVDGFHVVPLCANGRLLMPDGKVVDLYRDWLASAKPQEPNENPFSIGLRFEYGKFRFYTAGDFSDRHVNADGSRFEAEDEMAKVCGPCQVAKVNHHGYHSMSDRLLAALKSRVYVACMWDQLHMTRDTMRRLADRGNYPGERLICPAILTSERRQEDAAESWLAGIPKELYTGTHIVLDVPPGGETYSLAFVDAADESMRVKSVLDFQT